MVIFMRAVVNAAFGSNTRLKRLREVTGRNETGAVCTYKPSQYFRDEWQIRNGCVTTFGFEPGFLRI